MTVAITPTVPNLGIRVTPVLLKMFDGSVLSVTDAVPCTAAARRHIAVGGLLYMFGGRIDTPRGYLGGYLGQSADLDGPRAATSLTHWVVSQRRILPAGMALLRREEPYSD